MWTCLTDPKSAAIDVAIYLISWIGLLLYMVGSLLWQAADMQIAAHATGSVDQQQVDIFADTVLRTMCLLGSLAGAFMMSVFFPVKESDQWKATRQTLKEMACSFLMGAFLTPLVITAAKIPVTLTFVGPVALGISFFSVAVLRVIAPYAVGALEKVLKKKVDDTVGK